MPVKHDPTLRTPERIRAVAALHWFGVLQLCVAVCLAIILFLGYWTRNENPFETARFLDSFIGFLGLMTMLHVGPGISAIMAATGVCRRRPWSLSLGLMAVNWSLFWLLSFWLISAFRILARGTPVSYVFILYLCVVTILAVSARVYCLRLRKIEHRMDKPQ